MENFNRVATIQELTHNATWRHVPSADNPADIISRGTTPSSLVMNDLWLHRPQWLINTHDHWPNLVDNTASDVPELKQVHLTTTDKSDDFTLRFSMLSKLLRVIAYYYL